METRIFHVEKVPDFFNSQSPQSGPSVPQSLQGVFKMQISGFTTCFFGDRPPQICNVNNRPVVSALYNRGYCFSSVRERGYRKGVGLEGLLLPCFWIFNSYLQHPLLCLWHLCSPESLLDFPLYLGLPFLCDPWLPNAGLSTTSTWFLSLFSVFPHLLWFHIICSFCLWFTLELGLGNPGGRYPLALSQVWFPSSSMAGSVLVTTWSKGVTGVISREKESLCPHLSPSGGKDMS